MFMCLGSFANEFVLSSDLSKDYGAGYFEQRFSAFWKQYTAAVIVMYIKDMPMSVKITLEELVMRIICGELNVNEFAHISKDSYYSVCIYM